MANSELLPVELIVHILRGNVGLFSYIQCSAVSRAWRVACRSDMALILAVAAYTDGLTRSHFMGLLGLTFAEAVRFPHRSVPRAPRVQRWNASLYRTPLEPWPCYYIYGPNAVGLALAHVGGLGGWRQRLARAPASSTPRPHAQPWATAAVGYRRLRQWELEEACHRKKASP